MYMHHLHHLFGIMHNNPLFRLCCRMKFSDVVMYSWNLLSLLYIFFVISCFDLCLFYSDVRPNPWVYMVQEEYDTYDPKGYSSLSLPFLKKRAKIIEIVATHDIVFALAQSGVCAAFSRGIAT